MSSRQGMAAFANRAGRSTGPSVAGMVACAVLCVMAGGCATSSVTAANRMTPGGPVTAAGPVIVAGQVTVLRDAADFKQVALQGNKPVFVDFYMSGCSTCVPVAGMMDQLAEEYKGRATVAKFVLMQPPFVVTAPEIKARYAISFFPVVILFVNGQETRRFLRNYDIDDYRKAMDDALGGPTMRRTITARQ